MDDNVTVEVCMHMRSCDQFVGYILWVTFRTISITYTIVCGWMKDTCQMITYTLCIQYMNHSIELHMMNHTSLYTLDFCY